MLSYRPDAQVENEALKKLLEEVVSGSTVAQERVAALRSRYAHLLTVCNQPLPSTLSTLLDHHAVTTLLVTA